MSDQQTLPGFESVTGSPASEGGRSRFDWRAGRNLSPYGPARALASRSAKQALAVGLMTRATYGRPGGGSLINADLSASLASRLRALTDVNGSPEYALTWTYWDLPQGPPIYALLASARRTPASGSTGWPTPTPTELGNTLENYQAMKANMKSGPRTAITHLNIAAQAAGWATPSASDGKGANQPGQRRRQLAEHALLAGWQTPLASDVHGARKADGKRGVGLNTMAGWATPTAGDAKSAGSRNTSQSNAHAGYSLTDQARGDLGTGRSGSPASTEKPGVLNPELCRWLMGFPAGWLRSGDTGTE